MAFTLLRRVTVPAVAGLVLLSSACSLTGPEEISAPKDHVAVTQTEGVKPDKALLTANSKDDSAPGRLIGPHYSLGITGVSTATSVGEDKAEAYGFDGPAKAPKGSELLLAVMHDSSKVSSGAKAKLSVDGKDRALKSLPSGGGTIAAVAPKDADVLLSITDEKRTQTMDLRNGERDSQIDGFYTGRSSSPDLKDYSASGKATGQASQEEGTTFNPESRELDIAMTVDKAQRSPWDPEAGWADDGKVWVRIPVSELTTNSVWGFSTKKDSNEPIMTWKLAEKDTFSLQPKDGKKVKPEGDTTFNATDKAKPINKDSDVNFDPASAETLFQIPDDATDATFHIAPKGSLKAKWKDRSGDASWDDAPKAAKIKVAF